MSIITHKQLFFYLFIGLFNMACSASDTSSSLWEHLPYESQLDGSKGVKAEFVKETHKKTLYMTNSQTSKYNWCSIISPEEGWDLNESAFIEAQFTNVGDSEIELLFWVHANKGWDAVASSATLIPGESQTLSCNLWEAFPDGTPKINPSCIDKIQFMLVNAKADAKLVVGGLKAKGIAKPFQAPKED
ncbi:MULTISPECIES: hypothetical protein [unclassified Saccharicrinis]|uniref:hypothetical protein n=1 Tax=unclassified Saccharicrinis TaxID=2646859 RepID=UPI003D339628